MATYLQGITDYIPQLQPFQPDFNFLGNVLQTKQARYDAAHKQLSSLYGTMLNSPMLRDENIETRNEFFRSIDQNIKRLSGVDLSLQQNVDQASEMFKGLYEDKNIVKDMTWTKNWMNQRDKGKMLKTCPDPDKCGGQWWEGGDRYLDYKAQEFKNASKEEALGFQDVEYVAAQNFTEKAMKAAKDSGLSVKWDEIKGDWIVHHKNGKALAPSLSEFFISKFGNDPNMMSYIKAQTYLKRKDWVSQNLASYNNNEMEANVGYANAIYANAINNINKDKNIADENDDVAKNQSKQIDEYIKKNGYTPAQDWITDWQAIKDQTDITGQVKKVYENAVNNANLIKYNKDNIKLYLDQIDNAVAMEMLKGYSKNAAEEYSYGTEEQTRTANPFAVQAKNQAFQAAQSEKLHGFTYKDPQTGEIKYQPGTNYYEKLALKKLEWEHLDEVNTEALKKNIPEGGKVEPNVDKSKDSATPPIDPNLSLKQNEKKATTTILSSMDAKKNLVLSLLDAAIAANKKEQMSPGSGTKLIDLLPYLESIGLGGFAGRKNKINHIEILKNNKAEYDKYVNLLTSNTDLLDRAYNSSLKWGNPSDALGALAYSNGWTANTALQDKFSKYNEEAEMSTEDYNWMSQYNEQGTQEAKKIFTASMNEKRITPAFNAFDSMFDKTIDPTTKMIINYPAQSIKTSLLGVLDENLKGTNYNLNSTSDFKVAPQDYRLKMVHDAAAKWAESNKGLFKPEIVSPKPTSQKSSMGETYFPEAALETTYEPTGKAYVKSPFQVAYEFAVRSYSDLKPQYENMYASKIPAWNGAAAQSGNAKFSIVSSGYVDVIGKDKTESNKTLFELNQNFENLKGSGDAIVVTGKDFSKETLEKGNQDWASEILQGYMTSMLQGEGSDLDKSGKPKDQSRARAGFEWTKVAAASDDWVGYRLDFAPQWIEPNISTDKKKKLIPRDPDKLQQIQDGIVVFLKKNRVKGEFMNKSEYTVDDARMEHDGFITVENKSGSATLRRNPAGYYEVTTFANVVNDKGEIQAIGGEPEAVDQSFSPSLFRQMFKNQLNWLQYKNQHALGQHAAMYGKKDPNAVFSQSTQEQPEQDQEEE